MQGKHLFKKNFLGVHLNLKSIKIISLKNVKICLEFCKNWMSNLVELKLNPWSFSYLFKIQFFTNLHKSDFCWKACPLWNLNT